MAESSTGKKPIIVVFGCTGKQGNSVAHALLQDGRWHLRGVTKDPQSQRAKELQSKGVEIVQGEQQSREQLDRVFQGAYGTFVVTDFWDHPGRHDEERLGKNVADAAKEAGLRHFVISDAPNVKEMTKGKWEVPHMTDKARAADYAASKGFHRFTRVRPAFFYENWRSFFTPRREGSTLVFRLPMPKDKFLICIDVEDIGVPVARIFRDPDSFHGKVVPLGMERQHPQQYIDAFSEATGLTAKYEPMSLEECAKMDVEGARELADMFGWMNEFPFFGEQDWREYSGLMDTAKTFKQWVSQSGWRGDRVPMYGAE